MQHKFKGVLHFRLPFAPQRYNTLDFPAENRVPRGTLSPLDTPAKGNAVSLWYPMPTECRSPLLDDPEPKGFLPSGHPMIFFTKRYPNCVNAVCDRCIENIKRCRLHLISEDSVVFCSVLLELEVIIAGVSFRSSTQRIRSCQECTHFVLRAEVPPLTTTAVADWMTCRT